MWHKNKISELADIRRQTKHFIFKKFNIYAVHFDLSNIYF